MKTKQVLTAVCAAILLSLSAEAAPQKGAARPVSPSQMSAQPSPLRKVLDGASRLFGSTPDLPSKPKVSPPRLGPDDECPIDDVECRSHMPIGG